jgi:hypothetical protein
VIGNLKVKAVIHAVAEDINGFAETDPQHPMFGINPYFPNKLHKLMLLTYNKAA